MIPVPQDGKFTSVGPLVKLVKTPSTAVPANLKPLNFVLGSQIALLGYIQYDEQGHIVDHLDAGAEVLPITLYWKALTRPQEDYSVSMRLVDSSGKDVAQMDNKHPVLSLYPTSHWSPGEVVGDYYEMPLQDLAPSDYRLEVIMYASSGQGWHNLEIVDSSGHPVGERAVILSVAKR